MAKTATEHHQQAAEKLRQAADHHAHAATHHEQGDHPAAAKHAQLAHGHLVQAISHADDAAVLHANAGRPRALLAAAVPDIATRRVYVSGPPAMVAGVGAAARRLNVASVHTDYFSGY